MKYVVDSNCLRDERLSSFLRSSTENIAVLPDYAAMEALKGNALVGMAESMKILARFPEQVQVLKNTATVCGLSGMSSGLQRRLVDVPLSREFSLFCRNLALAKSGQAPLALQLQALGDDSRGHFARMEADARGFADGSVEIAKTFTLQERSQLLNAARPAVPLLHKLIVHVMELSAAVFDLHPNVRRLPTYNELVNTYVFRSSLCNVMLGFEYAAVGGVSGKASHKIRNDMVDAHFATYATYFDGLLSNDQLTNRLYKNTRRILSFFRH